MRASMPIRRFRATIAVILAGVGALVVTLVVTPADPAAAVPTMVPGSDRPTSAGSPTPARSTEPALVPVCPRSTTPDVMTCMAIRADASSPAAQLTGFRPADLRSAYSLPTSRKGATVAITDAYDDPHAEADLTVYRKKFGLPPCTTANGCFHKVNQWGERGPLPKPEASWAGEVSVDLDMVSAACPRCHILLVEAQSSVDTDLLAAINRAIKIGARFVSNSWGSAERSHQLVLDQQLNHPGVAITFSTGDFGYGYGPVYPASSRYVTAVGGTTLKRSANARGWSEVAWHGAGSGCSSFDQRPSWQTVSTRCPRRAEADVSAIADPHNGVAVYQTYGFTGWAIYGGTSVGTPIVAAMYALAGTPGAKDYPASYPYSHVSSFRDVKYGSNGQCGTRFCTAIVGWDGPTGLGTPHGVAGFTKPTPRPYGTVRAARTS